MKLSSRSTVFTIIITVLVVIVLLSLFVINKETSDILERRRAELLPISNITLGMSIEDLRDKYPDRDFRLPQFSEPDAMGLGFGFGLNVESNKFWTMFIFHIKDGEVNSLTYRTLYIIDVQKSADRNLGDVTDAIKILFEQLKQQLGSTFEREILVFPNENRVPMSVWKREKDIVAFFHTPISQWEKDGYFYQLMILPTEDALGKQFQIATDSHPEDVNLWLDSVR